MAEESTSKVFAIIFFIVAVLIFILGIGYDNTVLYIMGIVIGVLSLWRLVFGK